MEWFIASIQGKEYLSSLPPIWVTFEYLGILTWALFVIGVYFSFTRGGSLKRTMSLSAISFIIIIGLYYQYNYGMSIIYDRSFMYLYVFVTLLAGLGLSEIRKSLVELKNKPGFKKHIKNTRNLELAIPISICIVILLIAVPTHMDIGYYQLITEDDYKAFDWIDKNIDNYRDVNHTYDRAAVDPFKASPFSAVTGLYIVSSSMHPLYGYDLRIKMQTFLNNKCVDTSFLDKYKISVVYGESNNINLTQVYQDVYLYPGLNND